MEISRKTDYAIRLVAAMMLNEGKPISVRVAAKLQDVPYSFARGIQHDLAKSGIISTVRGAHGGMVLSADPDVLTLRELVETVQGPLTMAVCLTEDGWCSRDADCVFHCVWDGATEILRTYLDSVTIKELLEGKKASL